MVVISQGNLIVIFWAFAVNLSSLTVSQLVLE
jgi:hypothetical protein